MSTAVSEETRVVEAVFSVCAPSDFVTAAMAAVESVQGALFAGEFQEYITAAQRPLFPPVLKNVPVCVALVDCDANPEAALETMETLQQLLPLKVRLVGISENANAAFLLRAMRAGCSEILQKPLVPEELTSALQRFQAAVPTEAPAGAPAGKVIAFLGSRGGAGTTTLAVHVAMHLVKTHRKHVLLVDQKYQLGHLALYLGIKQTRYHFSELLRNADRLDSELLEGLTTHHSAGLDVLASPEMCTPRYETRPDSASSVFNFLRQKYDYILLDAEPESSQWLTAVLACCDEVDMICTPDVASLRDLSRLIEHLSLSDGFAAKLKVVINRSGSEPAISKDDIERAIRFPVMIEVPNNYVDLAKAANAGEPIPPGSKGRFTQAIAKWANALSHLTENAFQKAPGKRRFSLWG